MQPQILSQTENLFLFGYFGDDGLFYGTRVEGIGLTYDEPLCELSQPTGGTLTQIRVFYEGGRDHDGPNAAYKAYTLTGLPSVRELDEADPFWFDPSTISELAARIKCNAHASETRDLVDELEAEPIHQAQRARVYDIAQSTYLSGWLAKTWPAAARVHNSLKSRASRYFRKPARPTVSEVLSDTQSQYQM
ncbi:MAG: hypothetical protein AAFY03_07405 [Pseudomonadota bacterium]